MKIALKRKHRRQRRGIFSALFVRNPILVLGLDLPFVIVCATTLKTAAALSLEMLIIHMVTVCVALVTVRTLPVWLRQIVNIGAAFITMTVARYWITRIFPDLANYVGMYIYLMAVNGITVYQCFQISRKAKPGKVLVSALMNAFAFALTMGVVSAVREYFSAGALWGVPLPIPARLSGLAVPFGGFLLMGFFLALAKFINRRMLAFTILEARRQDARYTELPPTPGAAE